ncbi:MULTISPECIES: hypothetical protein [unclassified Frankia]|uniref:hypothetical protein n=1 Tax=unclassified Frankia TaxID=2632575 RepID=UPI002AD2FB46|nr:MULTISPECIES: hypothetical protein [unclassified Frankia]
MALNRRYAGAGTALAVLLVLAGCSAQTAGTAPTEPAIGEVPRLLESAALRLPVEDYLPSRQENERLAGANLVLIQRCMARFGIAYDVKQVPASDYGPISLADRRYGITDAELARTAGYGLGPRDPTRRAAPDKPNIGADGETVLSGQGRSVVNGLAVPLGGCIGEADRTLNKSVPATADLRRGNTAQLLSFEESKEDSRVRAVFALWSACMSESGYHYADPLAAAGDPAFTVPPSPAQISVALADIACKARTNVVGVWFTVDSAYQRRAIDADHNGFTNARTAIAARDRTAATVSP